MKSMLKLTTVSLLLLWTLSGAGPARAYAQSLVFNTPSTDVVASGKRYFEFDYVTHLESHQNGGYHFYMPRLVLGVGKGVEVGLNVGLTDALAPHQPVEIQPNAKWQFFANEKHGLAATVGGIGYLTIFNRQGTDNFALVYSNASKKFKGAYGPRFHGGAYGLLGRSQGLGSRSGAMVGYEQPLHAKVTFITDWFSGNNRFGYATPGLAVVLPKNGIFFTGYLFGNQGRKNNALYAGYGVTF